MDRAWKPFPEGSSSKWPAAVTYGPMVMGFKTSGSNPYDKLDFSSLSSNFIPVPEQPMTYTLASDPEIIVKPYYFFEENERYYMYFDPSFNWLKIDHNKMRYSGSWGNTEKFHFTNNKDDYVETKFTGTSFTLLYELYNDAGIARVSIDGEDVLDIDMYNPVRGIPAEKTFGNLSPGEHKIRITNIYKKQDASSNYYINVSAINFVNGE